MKTQRDQWGNGLEFLMSCIAMSVGLGNIWRFPFIANRNGGGAFLIPYIIVLTLIGRPMYFMEMALGQFSSRGAVKMYEKLSPVFKGKLELLILLVNLSITTCLFRWIEISVTIFHFLAIGYGQIIGSYSVATYYCSIMAVTLYYFINSFTSDFPWAKCKDSWLNYTTLRNLTCIDSFSDLSNVTTNTISSSELYFK